MRFFFSGELDGDLPDDHYRVVRQIVETRLNEALVDKSYGDAIKEIAIIPMILGPRFAEGRKERRLIQHREKAADYRLFIESASFANGTVDERKKMLLENVLICIRDIDRKLKGKFDGQRLQDDIRILFPELHC